jgi:glycosyltransferase involved in cell wall biosynthesis
MPAKRCPRVLLVNAFEKIPGEAFRDQRYTFLYQLLSRDCEVMWLSSDFHHWSHRHRSTDSLPPADRDKVVLMKTLAYSENVSLRRFVSYLALSITTIGHLRTLPWRPDVVLCMGPVEQMFFVSLYGRLHDVPVIIDVIDTWPDLYVQAFPRWLSWLCRPLLAPYFLLSRLTFAWASHVTAVSNTYLAWARKRGRRTDPERFACFPLGCRNPEFDAAAIVDARPPLRCLFAGQFGHSYDVELIVQAAARLGAAGRSDVEFVLCGDGSKRADLQRRSAGLRNVRLLGWMSPEEMNRLAADCHVGLCCYRVGATQSVPTKVFDYMSMGLFVISSLPEEADRLLKTHGAGASYRAGDVGSFLELLDAVAARVDLSPDARRLIRRSFETNFESQVIYARMIRDCIIPVARSGRAASLQSAAVSDAHCDSSSSAT